MLALIQCVVTDLKQCKQISSPPPPPPPPPLSSAVGQLCIRHVQTCPLPAGCNKKQCAAFPAALSGSDRQHKVKSASQKSSSVCHNNWTQLCPFRNLILSRLFIRSLSLLVKWSDRVKPVCSTESFLIRLIGLFVF